MGIIRDEKFIVEEGVQAFVGLSLETGEPGDRREVGVLYIDFKEPHRFSSNELYLIRFFGNLMATAIVNAQLLEDERQLRNQAMTLREVSSAISEANTLKDVGNKILTGLRSVVGFEKATIQLIEGDRRRLLAFSGFERKDIDRRLLRPISQDALIRRVISQATPSILPQVEDDPEWQKRKKTADIASWAGVPIVYSDETLGLITLDHSIPGYYTSSVENVLTLFASQAAIAVKKAQLIKDLEERVKDLAAHAKISQGLSSHESIAVHDMALLLHREARKLMNLNNFFVALYDIDRDSVTFELAIEDGREVPTGEREWRSRTKGTGLTERVIKRGHLLYIPNRVGEWRLRHRATDGLRYGTSYADWKKTRDPRIMAKSWLGVPIKLGKEVLGVIGAQNYDKTNAYDVFDRQVLSTIADQLGVALVRLWLERQNKELLALIRIGQTVSNLRIDEILDTVYEQMNNIMILSNAQVQFAFYDEDREEVIFPLAIEQDNGHIIDKVRWGRRESEFRNSGEDEDADGIVMLFKPRARRVPPGLTEYVIRTREPLIIEADFEQRTHELELVVWPQFGIKQRPTTSWLGVPMIVQDHVVGIISIQSLGNEPPVDAAQMRVLMTVAGQAAIAVENARLHQHLEQRAKELEKVNRALETANRRIAEREAMLVRALIAEDFVHRVNNLAGTIPIWVDLIRSEMSSDNQDLDATRNYLDEIQRDIDGLLRAAEELKKPSREQIVNVGFMLQSMLRQLRIQNRRIDAIDMVDKTLDRVVAVPSTLASALSNVIDNAADSIPKGAYGRVTVEAKNLVGQHGTKNVSIKISDDGEGISDIDIENLFIPFYSTKGDERGYGLWRSKSIIESLGGSIVLKSRRGIGTEVTILLPAAYERPE